MNNIDHFELLHSQIARFDAITGSGGRKRGQVHLKMSRLCYRKPCGTTITRDVRIWRDEQEYGCVDGVP